MKIKPLQITKISYLKIASFDSNDMAAGRTDAFGKHVFSKFGAYLSAQVADNPPPPPLTAYVYLLAFLVWELPNNAKKLTHSWQDRLHISYP
jgi:hypothetical protein